MSGPERAERVERGKPGEGSREKVIRGKRRKGSCERGVLRGKRAAEKLGSRGELGTQRGATE